MRFGKNIRHSFSDYRFKALKREVMTLHYYPETDSLYIELSPADSVDSRGVAPSFVLDFDTDGRVVGIDIGHASRHVDLTRLEANSLPIQALAVA